MPTLEIGIIKATVTITAMACPVCGVHYGLDESFRRRAFTGKQGWYCTNGHSLSFTESEADRLRGELAKAKSQLEGQRGWSQRMADDLNAERKSHAATKGQLTKTRNRIQGGVCPDCHRHFANVEAHMKTKHAEPTNAD